MYILKCNAALISNTELVIVWIIRTDCEWFYQHQKPSFHMCCCHPPQNQQQIVISKYSFGFINIPCLTTPPLITTFHPVQTQHCVWCQQKLYHNLWSTGDFFYFFYSFLLCFHFYWSISPCDSECFLFSALRKKISAKLLQTSVADCVEDRGEKHKKAPAACDGAPSCRKWNRSRL